MEESEHFTLTIRPDTTGLTLFYAWLWGHTPASQNQLILRRLRSCPDLKKKKKSYLLSRGKGGSPYLTDTPAGLIFPGDPDSLGVFIQVGNKLKSPQMSVSELITWEGGVQRSTPLEITPTAVINDSFCDLSQIFIFSYRRKRRGSQHPATLPTSLWESPKREMCSRVFSFNSS